MSDWSTMTAAEIAAEVRAYANPKDPSEKPQGWFMTRGEWAKYREVIFPIIFAAGTTYLYDMVLIRKVYSAYRLADGSKKMLLSSPEYATELTPHSNRKTRR